MIPARGSAPAGIFTVSSCFPPAGWKASPAAWLVLIVMSPLAAAQIMLYRLGRRRFWSVDLLWELPTAVFCAIGGGAASQFLGLDGIVSWGVVGAVSWLGPRGMEVMLARWFKLDPPGEPRSADEAKKEGK